MTFVSEFDPRALWSHFDRILTIPRASGNEEGMRRYVLEVAKRAGCAAQSDPTGNIVVRKPASPGAEQATTVILQSHLDMVPERRPDVAHDFARDPIVPRQEGEYLYATGTTLGADNGIGVATMLAILEDPAAVHPPLEMLFTLDEERGLHGAAGLDGSMLRGKVLLNLDSEEEGILYVGCAGGGDSVLTLPLRQVPLQDARGALQVEISGLRGGHSGMDIVLQRGNALQILARLLLAGEAAIGGLAIAAIEGGGARNAIPRDAAATVVLPPGKHELFATALQAEFAAVQHELRRSDPDVRMRLVAGAEVTTAWGGDAAHRVLRLLLALPHGVLAMSLDLPGLVETSSNVAVARAEEGKFVIVTNQRSSIASSLEAARARVRAIAALADAAIAQPPAYPAWQPDLESPLLATVRAVYLEREGRDADVRAVHAGLECGIIGEKVPGLDMISFGPQIECPHSPDERTHVPSVGRFYDLLLATLRTLATG